MKFHLDGPGGTMGADDGVAEAGEVYELGYEAGFRAGAVIGRRLAEGDDALRCALRELLDDGGLDA